MPKKYNMTNEQLALTSLIKDYNRKKYIALLNTDDFFGLKHKAIFQSVEICANNRLELNLQNIALNCENEFGGKEYLKKIFSLKNENVDFYIKKLLEESRRNKALLKLEELYKDFENKEIDFNSCFQGIKKLQEDLSITIDKDEFCNVNDWYEKLKKSYTGEHKHFVSTGYDSLDEVMTEGFFKGGVTVIAGRTSTGKSTFIRDVIYKKRFVKNDDSKILVVQQEGSVDSVFDSLISNMCSISINKIVKYPNELTNKEKRKIFLNKKILENDSNLYFINNPFIRLFKENNKNQTSVVYNKMEELFFLNDFDIIIFDLWERMLFKIDPGLITIALVFFQDFCVRSKTHGIIIHQLKRSADNRKYDKKKRPSLVDLKNSGAYEEFADQVILLHREKLLKRFMKDDLLEIRIAKQRRGETNITCVGVFEPEYCRITNDRLVEDVEDFGVLKPSMLE